MLKQNAPSEGCNAYLSQETGFELVLQLNIQQSALVINLERRSRFCSITWFIAAVGNAMLRVDTGRTDEHWNSS
jgi:hypothetical protein